MLQNIIKQSITPTPSRKKTTRSEARFCVREAGLIALGYAATGLNVAGILGINALLVACARALTLFERHRTRSQEARSLAVKLFLGQFLNSAVSTVLANAHLPALQRLVAGTRVQAILFQVCVPVVLCSLQHP